MLDFVDKKWAKRVKYQPITLEKEQGESLGDVNSKRNIATEAELSGIKSSSGRIDAEFRRERHSAILDLCVKSMLNLFQVIRYSKDYLTRTGVSSSDASLDADRTVHLYASRLNRLIECSTGDYKTDRCDYFTFSNETRSFLLETRRESALLYDNFRSSWLTFDATMAWLGIALGLLLLVLSLSLAVY